MGESEGGTGLLRKGAADDPGWGGSRAAGGVTQAPRRQGRACPAVLRAPRASSPLRGSPLLPPTPPLRARGTGRPQGKGLSGVVRAVPPAQQLLGAKTSWGAAGGLGGVGTGEASEPFSDPSQTRVGRKPPDGLPGPLSAGGASSGQAPQLRF